MVEAGRFAGLGWPAEAPSSAAVEWDPEAEPALPPAVDAVSDLEPSWLSVAMRPRQLPSVGHRLGILLKTFSKPLVLFGVFDQPSFHGRGCRVGKQAA